MQRNLIHDEVIIYQTRYHWVCLLSLQGVFSLFIIPLLKRYHTEFVITNKRVVVKKGMILIHTIEMDLRRVETVKAHVPLLGRILGYGNLTVIGCSGTREHFIKIKKPMLFRRAILEAATNYN